jgi:hypothetical protein
MSQFVSVAPSALPSLPLDARRDLPGVPARPVDERIHA